MGGREKNQSTIEIKVGDVNVAHDLMMLYFYGQKINPSLHSNTRYLLELFKCIPIYLLAKNWGEVFLV
jgi:hypothetical protein